MNDGDSVKHMAMVVQLVVVLPKINSPEQLGSRTCSCSITPVRVGSVNRLMSMMYSS